MLETEFQEFSLHKIVNYKVVSRFFYKCVHRFKKHVYIRNTSPLPVLQFFLSFLPFLLKDPSELPPGAHTVLPSSWLLAERELCKD